MLVFLANINCLFQDGSIYVVMNDNEIMDKEKNDRISLIVEATDGGSPPLKVHLKW
jgi:hypothetical protein